MKRMIILLVLVIVGVLLVSLRSGVDKVSNQSQLTRETAELTYAPNVPAPITRKHPAVVDVHLTYSVKTMELAYGKQYDFWTFNDHVPGPFVRARVGDTLIVHVKNNDKRLPHNCDFHSVTGPGGGAPLLTLYPGTGEKVAQFKLLHPGLYVYHCAAPPVFDHIANGMYGLILVEPEEGLSAVDKEFYVMESEFYTEEKDGKYVYKSENAMHEDPQYVVFNGRMGSLIKENSLKAKTGDQVRIFFGNGGPNLVSSFHMIGEIFDKVFREGDLVSPPGQSIQTTLVPAGGSVVVEFGLEVPGTFTLVDHSIFRVNKGAVGFLEVTGDEEPTIYHSHDSATPCEGCEVHP